MTADPTARGDPGAGRVDDPGDSRRPAVPAAGLEPPTAGQLAFYGAVRALVSSFCYLFWQVRVEGWENVPDTGPFVLAPVHRSNVDTALMACVARRRMRFLGKDTVWKFRWSAWLFTALGGIPVHRGTVDRDALRHCEQAIGGGEPIVIFPEGTRRSGPAVQDLFDGAAFIAVRTGTPIVPVGIGGSAQAMPKGSRRLHPVPIRLVIGPPIPAPGPEPGGGTRRQTHALTARLQETLQDLFDRAEAAARG
jgi:1-acyl-sn-glycerol-3-phosphate acyltransferase